MKVTVKLLTYAFVLMILGSSCKSGLVAYYPFDNNANDASGYQHHGTTEGATLSIDRHGKPNSSYYFDGTNDYIIMKHLGDVVPAAEITVSMWVKSLSSRCQIQMMLCPDNDRLGVSINYFHDGRNTIFWDFGFKGDAGNAPGRLYYRPEPVDTLWHQYVFVSSYTQKSMKIYKDKILLIEKDEPQKIFNTFNKDLKIGCGDNCCYFYGFIDDVRIYNKALSEKAIQKLYVK
jgi:hypothetical protein